MIDKRLVDRFRSFAFFSQCPALFRSQHIGYTSFVNSLSSSPFYNTCKSTGENNSQIFTSNYALHFIMTIIPLQINKNDEGLAYTSPNLICEIMIAWRNVYIRILFYWYDNSVAGDMTCKNWFEKIMRIYMQFAHHTAPILWQEFYWISSAHFGWSITHDGVSMLRSRIWIYCLKWSK